MFCLLKIHHCIGNDNTYVTHLHLSSRSTIQTDTATATLTFYYIGFKALTIVIVYNLYFFSCYKVSRIHEILINGDASHVVQICFRNGYTVKF